MQADVVGLSVWQERQTDAIGVIRRLFAGSLSTVFCVARQHAPGVVVVPKTLGESGSMYVPGQMASLAVAWAPGWSCEPR